MSSQDPKVHFKMADGSIKTMNISPLVSEAKNRLRERVKEVLAKYDVEDHIDLIVSHSVKFILEFIGDDYAATIAGRKLNEDYTNRHRENLAEFFRYMFFAGYFPDVDPNNVVEVKNLYYHPTSQVVEEVTTFIRDQVGEMLELTKTYNPSTSQTESAVPCQSPNSPGE